MEVFAVVRGDESQKIGAVVKTVGVSGRKIVGMVHRCIDGSFELDILSERRQYRREG